MKRVSGTFQTTLRNAFRRALTGDRVTNYLPSFQRLVKDSASRKEGRR